MLVYATNRLLPAIVNPPIDPGEADAKKASKAEKIRKLAEEKPEMTRAEIAREVGTDRSAVTHALKNPVLSQKDSTPKPPMIRLTLDPTRTAANIRAKMGDDYAAKLKEAL